MSSNEAADADIDNRATSFILGTGDADLVLDFRVNNGFRSDDKLNPFWEELQKYYMKKTTVHESRVNEVAYMPITISITDLIGIIRNRLPEGASVPSSEWLRLQFHPSNSASRWPLHLPGWSFSSCYLHTWGLMLVIL
jgi:hypothetical protein